MERFGKEIGVAILAGIAVAALWSMVGMTATHAPWSWPDFFGRGAAIAVPVGVWKVIGIGGILIVIGVAVCLALLAFTVLLPLLAM